MNFVENIHIYRFRSIRDASIDSAGNFSVLAGLNNSGKSNFLRALHAFFVGGPEPGVSFDVNRDYYRPESRSKKKKTIEITLEFSLPSTFHFRKGLESVESLTGREFALTKRWSRRSIEPEIFLDWNQTPLGLDDAARVKQFLNLVSFRYIPNRVVPTEVIADHQGALRDILIRRLAKQKQQTGEVLDAIRDTAQAVISDVSHSLGQMVPDVEQVRLATATTLADLAFRFGYHLTDGTIETDEAEQGSGIQSLLMFQTLHLIDRDFFQQFGWKQAAIWAVEEPESSLHTALEAEVAQFLALTAKASTGRLQTFATTHSDLMVQYSDAAYLIQKSTPTSRVPWKSSVVQRLPSAELLSQSARSGISRWVNPVLYYHIDPLILVEGITDQEFITQSLRILTGSEFRVAALSTLLGNADQGGVQRLKQFLRENSSAIRSRPNTAPVIVVLDWDAKNLLGQFQSLFSEDDPFVATVWPEADANPMLDNSFRGIERFFTDQLVTKIETVDTTLTATKADGTRTINPADYSKFKAIAAQEVSKGLQEGDLVHSREFILALSKQASHAA